MTDTQNYLIMYDRRPLEAHLLRCANWLDANVDQQVTDDEVDRTGFFLAKTYEALADFVLAFIQQEVDRSFFPGPVSNSWMPTHRGGSGADCIVQAHFDYIYQGALTVGDIQRTMLTLFYQSFEAIVQSMAGIIGHNVHLMEQRDRTVDSVYFQHARPEVGALVLVSIPYDDLADDNGGMEHFNSGRDTAPITTPRMLGQAPLTPARNWTRRDSNVDYFNQY